MKISFQSEIQILQHLRFIIDDFLFEFTMLRITQVRLHVKWVVKYWWWFVFSLYHILMTAFSIIPRCPLCKFWIDGNIFKLVELFVSELLVYFWLGKTVALLSRIIIFNILNWSRLFDHFLLLRDFFIIIGRFLFICSYIITEIHEMGTNSFESILHFHVQKRFFVLHIQHLLVRNFIVFFLLRFLSLFCSSTFAFYFYISHLGVRIFHLGISFYFFLHLHLLFVWRLFYNSFLIQFNMRIVITLSLQLNIWSPRRHSHYVFFVSVIKQLKHFLQLLIFLLIVQKLISQLLHFLLSIVHVSIVSNNFLTIVLVPIQ